MALPETCFFRPGAGVLRRFGTKLGSSPERTKITYYGIRTGAAADGPVSGAEFLAFQIATNRLAEALGRPERLEEEPWLGLAEFELAAAMVALTPTEHRGAAMAQLVMIDLAAVTEEGFRSLVNSAGILAKEMNAAVDKMSKSKAEARQSFMPILVGGVILAFALRGMAKG